MGSHLRHWGSPCARRTPVLWRSCSATTLSLASLGFPDRGQRFRVLFHCPKDLVLLLCRHSLAPHSRISSRRLCVGSYMTHRDGRLSQSTQCSSRFQSLQGAHEHASEQSPKPRDPAFSWSRCLYLRLVQMCPLKTRGGYGTWLLCCAMNMVQV